jgi:Ser/Thr protein kinase RdoA (MazF antagonist)
MNAIVERALVLWGLKNAPFELAAARENAVYRVTTPHGCFALRLHRQGYRSDRELWSELQWMAAVAAGGISVPDPVPSASGQMLHVIDGIQVDVLTWLSGTPLVERFETLEPIQKIRHFETLGRDMARLHHVSDAWTLPDGFVRCAWNSSGLVGDNPLWNRFEDNPALTTQERDLFIAFRKRAFEVLTRLDASLDYGLIHADLVPTNVMIDRNNLRFIDFDDGGFGYRLFEVATALLKFSGHQDFNALRTALITGYHSVRRLDLKHLDLFMALRATTYVGWNITRMTEGGAVARNARFIATAKHFAQAFLTRLD